MQTRRSVRHFSAEQVTYELIENAIRTAGSAPSGANQQPWTFVVVSDPAVKERLREAAEREERLLYEKRASEEYLHALEQTYGLDEDGKRHKHYYVRESVGIAVGFLLASLHAAGLCTLAHSPSPMG